MSERKVWTNDQIADGIAEAIEHGPTSNLIIHLVSLFQRGVIALEEIAAQGRPVSLLNAMTPEDEHKFHSDGLGMSFTDEARPDIRDEGPYTWENGIKYMRGQNPSSKSGVITPA